MRAAVALLCILLGAGAAIAEPIEISAKPISYFSRLDPERTEFGQLTFRGGLVLTSKNTDFGGFSGIRVAPDGRFLAVSDRAMWLEGRLNHQDGTVTGITDAAMFPVRGASGRGLAGSSYADTEGLEIDGETAWIGVERRHSVLRFDLAQGPQKARASDVPLPKAAAGLPYNAGLEALGLVPDGPEKGTLLVVAEEGLDAGGNHKAWLLAGRTKKPARALSVKRRDEFAITDLDFLPGGDLVILERRYRPPFSLHMRLRRIPLADIAAGAVLDGEVLLEASLGGEEIDNMEGVSARRAEDGTSVLTLISDDNFNGLQRTVLLEFSLAD